MTYLPANFDRALGHKPYPMIRLSKHKQPRTPSTWRHADERLEPLTAAKAKAPRFKRRRKLTPKERRLAESALADLDYLRNA